MEDIRNVAVIGAGISGVCSAAYLLKQGLSVTVFERSSIAGGIWHYDERPAVEPAYPNEVASRGDYERVSFEEGDDYITPPLTPEDSSYSRSNSDYDPLEKKSGLDIEILGLLYAPPGPCYVGLRNNVALTLMKTALADWPSELKEYVNHKHIEEYIQKIAHQHQVNQVTKYNTRVEGVKKIGEEWRLRTTSARVQKGSLQLVKETTFFDAVVVASGHYHMPRIPEIPGLEEWKAQFPDRVQHSKSYRHAKTYQNSRILIIGAGVSSTDIAKELAEAGAKVWQSSRGGPYDLPASSLPGTATRVAGVSSFVLEIGSADDTSIPAGQKPIMGRVIFTDGTELRDLHYVILATGYITSYPFLKDKHSDDRAREEVDDHLLITKEGDMVHNLHKDIFYIEDPSLAFVGVPYHISTFSLFDVQAQVVARVFAGVVKLPARYAMREEHVIRVHRRGLGREFHSLWATGAEIRYVRDLVEWVNLNLATGIEPMSGHTKAWYFAHKAQREQLAQMFGGALDEWVPKDLLAS
ncbi:hypothetical protein H2198_007992 [Neophaeococcomyces mojaviensis]|uniref:Uncharacterized protein n=1 Tax=Neophaeococcomyces mojaviensis TaxID=3383035 RepID=A0ACC2ZYI9_9EURO|nr:hypothetical protein H2198_007992 [Knufia sp. JES_112]